VDADNDRESEDAAGPEERDDDEAVNDPLTRSDVEAPRAPWGTEPDQD
jgi:hypothetical protein